MAKRGRPRIHPPNTPKGEDPAVTIANQSRQIEVLISRCEELKRQNESLEDAYNASFQTGLAEATRLAEMEKSYLRMKGWQDCAREIIGSITIGGSHAMD